MELDYRNMKMDELEPIYFEAERLLQKMLLNGAPWSEVQEQMLVVTQLSIVIHQNKYPLTGELITHPSNSENENNQQG